MPLLWALPSVVAEGALTGQEEEAAIGEQSPLVTLPLLPPPAAALPLQALV